MVFRPSGLTNKRRWFTLLDMEKDKTVEGMSSKMTNLMKRKAGRVLLHKGTWNGIPMQLWDFSQTCVREKCGIGEVCTYKGYEFPVSSEISDYDNPKEEIPTIFKCPLHAKYLHSVLVAALNKLSKMNMSEENAVKLGYTLIPLYNQLFKFKLIEYNIVGEDVLTTTAKGDIKVHPIFKMIQDTMKTIAVMWKDLGGRNIKPPNPNTGDQGFLEALFTVDDDDDGYEGDSGGEYIPPEEGTGMDFDSIEEPPMARTKRTRSKPVWDKTKN